jgi:hypothetical protein
MTFAARLAAPDVARRPANGDRPRPYKEVGGIIIAAHQTASHLDFMAVTS